MYTYQLVINSNEILRSDGAIIPDDPKSIDYQAYQQWLAQGNVPQPVPLSVIQASQVVALSNACAASIINGFTSSVLGAPYLYPAKDTDQWNRLSAVAVAANLIAGAYNWKPGVLVASGITVNVNGVVYSATNSGTTGVKAPAWHFGGPVQDNNIIWEAWLTPLWCANSAGAWLFVEHTTSQVQQLESDVLAQRTALQQRNKSLIQQVLAVDTAEQVHAIIW